MADPSFATVLLSMVERRVGAEEIKEQKQAWDHAPMLTQISASAPTLLVNELTVG
jgi:hypothetical protein